ncbi:zinc finger protein [Histomonas meleagridis]|uniref:zinc finger protein ZPR1 n=1 Tax=Histomonas meleagridis TaxID=135588 RepID=UPI0035598B7C|nr:zinc finger protein [Histomonas meleagridis]KAH0798210.1 zinc finger protein ZPR1 [Histomonas meleagridis]
MESLCMNCMKNGTSTLLLTKIPFFREVMISRFECPHCNFQNNSVQFAGEYPAKGVHYELHVKSPEDLNRRIVKSCHGVIKVPAIDLEIPGPTQGDSISTIEGVLEQTYEGLKTSEQTPALVEFLDNLQQCVKGLVQFDLILDDPSGNSFIENPLAPQKDPNLSVRFYKRTPEQAEAIGLMTKPQTDNFELDDGERIDSVFAQGDNEVMSFDTECPVCSVNGTMKSCTLHIPHFKEINLMAFNCDSCGYHNAEVLVGGAVSPKARKITLHADSEADLNRELLKSETASIKIPECDLELIPGTLGGKFTTVEGLMRDIHSNLKENNPFANGDSAMPGEGDKIQKIIEAIQQYYHNKVPFTLIMDDPLANSYIQVLGDKDDKLVIEDYERTFEQNEVLGINDMITEGYETIDENKKEE